MNERFIRGCCDRSAYESNDEHYGHLITDKDDRITHLEDLVEFWRRQDALDRLKATQSAYKQIKEFIHTPINLRKQTYGTVSLDEFLDQLYEQADKKAEEERNKI